MYFRALKTFWHLVITSLYSQVFLFFCKAVQLEDLSYPARDKTQTLGTKIKVWNPNP